MDVAIDMSDLAFIHWKSGDRRAALEQYDRARAIREALVRADPNDTHARLALSNTLCRRLGAVLWSLGKREDALADQRSALALLDALAVAVPTDIGVQEGFLLTCWLRVSDTLNSTACSRRPPPAGVPVHFWSADWRHTTALPRNTRSRRRVPPRSPIWRQSSPRAEATSAEVS